MAASEALALQSAFEPPRPIPPPVRGWGGMTVCTSLTAGESARRAEPARRPPELAGRGLGGAAEGHCQGGHGRETGRRWGVGFA
jgi:hypothetical protein